VVGLDITSLLIHGFAFAAFAVSGLVHPFSCAKSNHFSLHPVSVQVGNLSPPHACFYHEFLFDCLKTFLRVAGGFPLLNAIERPEVFGKKMSTLVSFFR